VKRGLLIATAALVMASASQAAQVPVPGAIDPRIQTVFYDPEQVVSLRAFFGYQMLIEFGQGERIENVSIGDGLAWQVTPNRKADLLFIKPVEMAGATNMTVVTDQRRYAFELTASRASGPRASDMAYVVRFIYPQPPAVVVVEAPPPEPPQRRNVAYSYTGSRATLPSVVFDDGRFTYFQWPESTATPALFQVAPDGSESIVNYGMRDGFLVVEQIAPRFVVRNGKDVTTVINEGWREPVVGAEAPRLADPATAKAAGKAVRP
jgi:type IV secretion system protein VirB9